MRDQQLERNLRAVLRAEGDGLALTITAAELERRLALRRRGRTSRSWGLVLAATLAVGLVGAVGAASGWFDSRPVPSPSTPDASAVAIATREPSAAPMSGLVALPTLDELIETVGTERVVAAQAFGRSNGTEDAVRLGETASIDLGPVPRTGSYRVWIVCAGSQTVQLSVSNRPDLESPSLHAVDCTGRPMSIDENLADGARVKVLAPRTIAWRAVLTWQGDPVVDRPRSIVVPTPEPRTIILDTGGGPVDEPNYGPVPSPWQIRDVQSYGPVPTRDSYSVVASCAGPDRIRYGISRNGNVTTDDDWIAQVELPCDGRLHRDNLGFSLDSGSLTVSAVPMVQWRLMLVGEAPSESPR